MEQEKKAPKKRSKSFLVGYSIALFLFASVLIMFSYFSQARETNRAIKERDEQIEVAAGFESRLQQVSETNAALEEKVGALEEELAAAKDTVNSSVYAYEILWKLICAERDGDKDACASYLKQASELDMETLLSETGFAEYTRIKSKFKGAN